MVIWHIFSVLVYLWYQKIWQPWLLMRFIRWTLKQTKVFLYKNEKLFWVHII
jgi:hypothetical protein